MSDWPRNFRVSTQNKIKKTEQHIAKLERSKALQTIKQRKQATRQKIEWGGLVVKSEMHGYTKDIILGALLDARQQIESDPASKRLFELKGKDAFLKDKNKEHN